MTEPKTLEQSIAQIAVDVNKLSRQLSATREMSNAQADEIEYLKALLKECLDHPVKPHVLNKIKRVMTLK
jgi:hypothetical protein